MKQTFFSKEKGLSQRIVGQVFVHSEKK